MCAAGITACSQCPLEIAATEKSKRRGSQVQGPHFICAGYSVPAAKRCGEQAAPRRKMYHLKGWLRLYNAITRTHRRGAGPGGPSPSPAHPCACFSAPAAHGRARPASKRAGGRGARASRACTSPAHRLRLLLCPRGRTLRRTGGYPATESRFRQVRTLYRSTSRALKACFKPNTDRSDARTHSTRVTLAGSLAPPDRPSVLPALDMDGAINTGNVLVGCPPSVLPALDVDGAINTGNVLMRCPVMPAVEGALRTVGEGLLGEVDATGGWGGPAAANEGLYVTAVSTARRLRGSSRQGAPWGSRGRSNFQGPCASSRHECCSISFIVEAFVHGPREAVHLRASTQKGTANWRQHARGGDIHTCSLHVSHDVYTPGLRPARTE